VAVWSGAGTALDAATRGLSVALLEARDWASGTSSRSSKLVHGGLRYLEMLDFALVREALRERGLILDRLAPHLVRPVSFLYPLTRRGWERPYVAAGLMLYDTMGSIGTDHPRGVPRHRHLTRRKALQVAPALRKDALGRRGAVLRRAGRRRAAHDVPRPHAASYGALCANRARVVGFLRQGERVTGVQVRDGETGRDFEVRAKQVVNATGVWTDDTQALVGERGQFHVRASKGIHLVVPRDRVHSDTGLILRTEKSVLFVIPWGRHWIVGTTDTEWTLDKAHPAASRRDIDYVLERVNAVLVTPLTHEDVEGVYAGLRPLLAEESEATSKLSREHTVAHPAPGLVVVAGGKYTTYRVMAKDAVDAAAHGIDGRCRPRARTACRSWAPTGSSPCATRVALAAASACTSPGSTTCSSATRSLTEGCSRSSPATRRSVSRCPAPTTTCAPEIVYAASHEGARHLDDVPHPPDAHLDRDVGPRLEASVHAARLMAPCWAGATSQIEHEIERYRLRVEAERESQTMPDDETA
jgi:glycerol-3-phosphate dehydrogenase